MTTFKRSIGLGALLLAVLGLLVCVAGIIGVWAIKSRVDTVRTVVFETADNGLAVLDTKLDRVKEIVEGSRLRVRGISKIAERMTDKGPEIRNECEPLLKAMDKIYQELQSAESWLDTGHAVASGIGRVSEAVASSDFAAAHQDSMAVSIAGELQQFADAATDTLAELQAVRAKLIELRDTGQLVRDTAGAVLIRVADLDGRLANLTARIEKLDTRLATARENCAELNRRLAWWTFFAAVAASLVLAWFAVSQVVVMGYAWRLCKASG